MMPFSGSKICIKKYFSYLEHSKERKRKKQFIKDSIVTKIIYHNYSVTRTREQNKNIGVKNGNFTHPIVDPHQPILKVAGFPCCIKGQGFLLNPRGVWSVDRFQSPCPALLSPEYAYTYVHTDIYVDNLYST